MKTWTIALLSSFLFSLSILGQAAESVPKAASAVSAKVAQTTVNVNQADAATLAEAIKGVGLKRAKSIVAYRTKHGPFKNLDDLQKVKGVGAGVLKKNAGLISF